MKQQDQMARKKTGLQRCIMGLLALGVIAISFGGSCSRKAEQISAEEMAEQMEAAKEGREAAKAIVTKNWTDTMALQLALIDARARNSKYEIAGKTRCKAKFDSAFFGTIRTVRPDLADQIQP